MCRIGKPTSGDDTPSAAAYFMRACNAIALLGHYDKVVIEL